MTRRALEGRLAGDMALAVGCSPERFIVMLVTDMSESCEVVVLVLPSFSSSSSSRRRQKGNSNERRQRLLSQCKYASRPECSVQQGRLSSRH